MLAIPKYLKAFADIVYPRICAGCGYVLLSGEHTICSSCLADIPFTGFEIIPDNPVGKLFWGRVDIERAMAMFYFEKSTHCQQMLHELKYNHKKHVGYVLGNLLGQKLKNTAYANADLIIPVPLHPARERKRGYNQSEIIAVATASVLGKKLVTKNVLRNKYTKTQTKKHRYERWENIQGIFQYRKPGLFANKHLLLIDDVVTTGATIESLAAELLKIPGVKISLATLAVSKGQA